MVVFVAISVIDYVMTLPSEIQAFRWSHPTTTLIGFYGCYVVGRFYFYKWNRLSSFLNCSSQIDNPILLSVIMIVCLWYLFVWFPLVYWVHIELHTFSWMRVLRMRLKNAVLNKMSNSHHIKSDVIMCASRIQNWDALSARNMFTEWKIFVWFGWSVHFRSHYLSVSCILWSRCIVSWNK